MTRVRQLAPVTAASAITTAWLAALGLVTTPFLLNSLGASAYAVFALITIMTAYLLNLEFGFGHATVRYLARAHAEGDEAATQEIISTSFVIFLLCGALASGLAFAGSEVVVRSFANFPAAIEDQAVEAVRLGSLILILTFLGSFSGAALQALGRFSALIGSRLVFGSLSSAAAIIAAAAFADVRAVLLGQAVVALGLATFLLLALRAATGVRPRFVLHRRTLRLMGGFSGVVFATGITYQVMIQGPPTVLAGAASSAELAVFAVPALVMQQFTLLARSASVAFLPFASGESVASDRTRLAAVFTAHLRLTILVVAPLAGFLAVFAYPLLSAWVGSDFASDASTPLRLLAVAALMLVLSSPAADVARAVGKPSWVLAFTISTAFLGLTIALQTIGRYGATGAALALAGSLLPTTVPFVLLISRRLLVQPTLELVRCLAGPVVAGTGLIATFVVLEVAVPAAVAALITSVAASLLYVALVRKLVLTDVERRTLAAGAVSVRTLPHSLHRIIRARGARARAR